MAHEPRVSVLLPAYNAAATLEEAIESILVQDYSDFELLVINDGSTDDTPVILQRYAPHPNVRIVHQENRGLIDTLNDGLTLCRGEFIARMDADDIATPDRLRRQVEFMQANPDVVCCGTAVEFFGDKHGVWRLPFSHEACVDTLLLGSCFAHPSVMLRRSTLSAFGIAYDKTALHAEDYALWCELAAVGRLANLDFVGLRYRVHGAQVSMAKREHQIATHLDIAQRFREQLGLRRVDRFRLSNFLFGDRTRCAGMKSRFDALKVLLTLNAPWRGYRSFWKTFKVFARRHIVVVLD
jgi:glycosyltransferase involved in cell wall biosynthesis